MSDDAPAGAVVAAGAAPSILIVTPAAWNRLDLDPRTRAASLAALVTGRLGDGADMLAGRRELVAALRGFARDAAASGAIYAAIMLAAIDGVAVQASLVASVADIATAQPDPVALTAMLAAGCERTDDHESSTLTAPVGECARLVTVVSTPIDSDLAIPALVAQYAVPIPLTTRAVVFSFSTPNVEVRASMLRLFDRIVGAARWTGAAAS